MGSSWRFNLEHRTVIITGGGKGIGKVYSQEFARAGANVVIADIDCGCAEAIAETIRAEGHHAISVQTNVAELGSTREMARVAIEKFGSIDILVNNASLMSVLPRRSWLEIPEDEWDRVMAVNLRGLLLCCRAVFASMRDKGRGKIVNISSSRVWEVIRTAYITRLLKQELLALPVP
jgi:3-oxoacyl-[acyl-carrier protein] reductase